MPQTQLIFSAGNVSESVKVLKEIYQDLPSNRLYFYFPFTEEELQSEKYINEQIERDSKKINIEVANKELSQFWNNNKDQMQKAFDILASEGSTVFPVYRCNLTYYGTYGYYQTPDTIFVNISKGSVEFWAETLLHELLHLVLYNQILNLSYKEAEIIVDRMFIRLFGSLFPNYQEQFTK